ncbi:MAG: SRPBCC family protein [Candidatus Limnocylindrales bacterium]
MTETRPNVVVQTVRISARPETVWHYWTDPRRICDWWGAAAELDPRPGGVCRVEMSGGPVMVGEYLELVPYERLVFSFGWEQTDGAPAIAPGESRVEITLTEDSGDTIMTLRHTGIPDALAELHASGWSRVLPILVAAADSRRRA